MKNSFPKITLLSVCLLSLVMATAQQTTTEKEIQNAEKEIKKANKEVKVANIQIERSAKESMAKALKPIVVEGFPINGSAFTTMPGYHMNMNQNFDHVFNNLKDVKAKEVSQEISTSKSPEIYLDNTSRNIQIKIWDQSKVKVVTTVYFEGEGKLSDEEWFEKMNLSLKSMGTAVRIKSGNISGGSYTINGNTFGWSGSTGVAVFNDKGESVGSKSNTKRMVTIYVPAASKLDIDSKYADVQLLGNYGSATIDLTNGNLEAENFSKLYLRSKYSNATIEDAAIAEIEFMNGRFSAKEIGEADLDTKYATIDIASVKKAVFRSTNDEYEIEDANELRGRKNYGNFRITKLNGSLEMDGTNADIKIRNVGSTLDLIKIDNKYADIRIPLKAIKNYSIKYSGAYSTVYGNFEKEPLIEEQTKPLLKEKETDALAKQLIEINRSITRYAQSGDAESRFSAKVGDGKGLKIDMNCQNCTVDFK
ncbi:MAG: hypothetical protein Q7U77_07470 [Sediminibacterium sp.]|uniref:hypothetical protein n=1 Tax=Sediminibacterium sp. TaxID=1917865 RepID=UPI00272297C2|nr:hypothetical protein [Sediminibacterium sp.]MDO8996451.1 hypothetical protein [Sediminibacterium sp.]